MDVVMHVLLYWYEFSTNTLVWFLLNIFRCSRYNQLMMMKLANKMTETF